MKRAVLIANPHAGRGTAKKIKTELEHFFLEVAGEAGYSGEIFWTERQRHATEIAETQSQAELILAAGGDGTLHEVLQSAIRTKCAVGIVPVGTGNDFSRHIGIGLDWKLAIRQLKEGACQDCDVGEITVAGEPEPIYFLNVAGCGFDAAVAQRINRGFRFVKGTAAYTAGIFSTLSRFRGVPLTLTFESTQTQNIDAMMCSIGNTSSYGGGMKIAPLADLQDGKIDICTVARCGIVEFLRAFPMVFKGSHLSHPKVSYRQVSELKIESNEPLPILVDGEVRGQTPAQFRVLPKAVRVLMPQNPNFAGK